MAAESAPAAPALPDRYLARYEIKKRMSSTCSELWVCTDQVTNCEVVVKILPPWAHNFHEVVERFKNEARYIQHIDHPNVVKALDSFTEPHWGIVMEHAGEQDLWEWIESRPSLSDRLLAAWQMAAAVAAVHAADLLHFDIKLANFMIDEGRQVQLGDFGLAVTWSDRRPIAARGNVVGTAYYMAPENNRGEDCDERSDIYSLGSALYVLFTGQLMFEGASEREVALKHCQEQPPPLGEICGGLPAELVELVHACVEKDPANRPQLAADVMVDLLGIQSRVGAMG